MVKSTIWLVLIINFASYTYPTSTSSSIKYKQEALDWAYNAFFSPSSTISEKERSIILNYIYCAYWRSRTTIEAQKSAYGALVAVWRGWQNIAQTRMNPSLEEPYKFNSIAEEETFKEFRLAQRMHRSCGKTYAQAAEYTVKGSHSKAHDAAITVLRERARHVVMKEFLNIKESLGDLFDFVANYYNKRNEEEIDIFRFDLLESITSLIPQSYAMYSFIESEKIQNCASKKCWQTFETITEVNQKIWNAVETARMEYYEAYYDAIMYYLEKNNTSIPFLMFWEAGLIPSHELSSSLKLPKNIIDEPVHPFSLMS